LVATEAQGVEVYRRAGEVWVYRGYGPGEHLLLESLGVRLAVDALYRLTDVPLPGAGQSSAPDENDGA
jgi:hypothetical protein